MVNITSWPLLCFWLDVSFVNTNARQGDLTLFFVVVFYEGRVRASVVKGDVFNKIVRLTAGFSLWHTGLAPALVFAARADMIGRVTFQPCPCFAPLPLQIVPASLVSTRCSCGSLARVFGTFALSVTPLAHPQGVTICCSRIL